MKAAYLQRKNLKLISEIKCSDKEVQEQVKLGLGQVFATNEENNSLSSWPHWMLQLILEMLVNGTPPSSIPMNIRSQANITMQNIIIESLPTARFFRSCRTNLRILGETLTSYRLAKAKLWIQLFTDGTAKRQIAIQNLIIRINEDKELKDLVVSSAIIIEGESSQQQCDAIIRTIKN